MDGLSLLVAAALLGAGLALGLLLRRPGASAEELARTREDLAGAQGDAVRSREALAQAQAALARAGAEREAAERRARDAAAEVEAGRRALEGLRAEAGRLGAERAGLAAELAAAQRAREEEREQVGLLAAKALGEQGRALAERSQESLKVLLAPVAEKLRAFEEKIDRTYGEEGRDRARLLQQMGDLQKAQARLHEDADALSRALTGDSKAQGDWGEVILERLLEVANLVEGRDFELQVSHDDGEGGRKRPDALVYLPGDRAIVVDAKCSLTAFVEATRATDPAAREAALDRHVASLRAHVKGLAAKRYPEVLRQRTLDLVLLFVPSEAAFHAALARDPALPEEAFRQRIVICSPTTLLACLQSIWQVWQSERQGANAQRIAEEAGRLLDKLSDFVADLDQVGERLDQAHRSWDQAQRRLRVGPGNVMKRAADLVKLGAPVKPDRQARLLGAAAGDGEPLEAEAREAEPRLAAVPPVRTEPAA